MRRKFAEQFADFTKSAGAFYLDSISAEDVMFVSLEADVQITSFSL